MSTPVESEAERDKVFDRQEKAQQCSNIGTGLEAGETSACKEMKR